MLCLTRRQGESVIFFDADGKLLGRITVDHVTTSKVKLQFDFPTTFVIERDNCLSTMPRRNRAQR